jgi:hypothetical protein
LAQTKLHARCLATHENYIKKFRHKAAIEDIAKLDSNLTQKVIDNLLLLKEINKAILIGELTKDDIK